MPAKKQDEPEPVRIRAEGEEGGHAQAAFDPEKRLWFRLNTLKERCYFECPSGHSFDEVGRLIEG